MRKPNLPPFRPSPALHPDTEPTAWRIMCGIMTLSLVAVVLAATFAWAIPLPLS